MAVHLDYSYTGIHDSRGDVTLRVCKWYKGEYGWIRVQGDESLVVINGKRVGSARVYWDNLGRLADLLANMTYQKALLEPEHEVFV